MDNSQLKNELNSLPDTPGVYKFFDKENTLIYIGKAKNLKKRVTSYFTKNHYENRKTAVMVSKVEHLEFTLVDSEIDALLLENSLIKKYQPKFNINLKDDKTYPFICIKKEPFPRVFPTRNPIKDGSDYFGPYASVSMMRTIIELIRQLYPTRTCNLLLSEQHIKALKYKTCLEYQIGNCKAPCVGYQTTEEYDVYIKQIKNILRGNIKEVINHIKGLMQQAAGELKFEQAADFKKKLDVLENYQSKSTIVTGILHDVDVFSIVSEDKFAFINYLKLSNGMIIQSFTFDMKKRMEETDAELLELAIGEVRERFKSLSKEIIIPFELELEDTHITFTVPKSGDKKKLLELSIKNALYFKKDRIAQYEKLNPEIKTERILNKMQSDLRLKTLPKHIECFDNSNIQGTNAVSACVVFKDAKPSKKDYRHFNVKTVVGPDDFATMREVVYRRYKRVVDEGEELPDLIVIDGGKGQLNAAIESMQSLGIYGKVPVIGIAKRLEELYYPDDELPLYLDKKSETLRVIQHIRDEAHRFGITHHRKRRSKNMLVTELEEIKGIGQATATLLLNTFKSVKKIKEADIQELIAIVGESKATEIKKHFE
ncbi:MAG: excinuclease ABC subunit UvrC [Bacteroidia bacterium]|jgi:excinuclease ABC subunit C|nr:excinuclease ABC subunit UvrC [Bacteroidia bacterium]